MRCEHAFTLTGTVDPNILQVQAGKTSTKQNLLISPKKKKTYHEEYWSPLRNNTVRKQLNGLANCS